MGIEGSKIGDYFVDRNSPLGEGAFGAVYKGKHAKKGYEVAVKRCIIHSDQHGFIAMKEIKNFQRIPEHKHIVKMMDYEYVEKSFWIVMEYCDRGDLDAYVKRYSPSLDRQLKIMYQCACAVSHMHSQEHPIVHRDLKPQNILFRKEGEKEVVKIADFGLTKIVESTAGEMKMQEMLTTKAGSPPFMAPEIYAGNRYDESVDVFALGLVFLAMINHKTTDKHLFPLSASAIDKSELSCYGQELLQAKLNKSTPPVLVKMGPLDNSKMKGIKTLICDMTNYEGSKRKKMKNVVDDLQKIAGVGNPDAMISGRPSTAKRLMLSNLSVAKTKASPLLTSTSGLYLKPSGKSRHIPSTVGEEDEDIEEDETDEEDSDEDSDEEPDDDSTTPDIGYLLMRRMMEDALRKKKESEIQGRVEREKAEQAAALLPLLALLKLVDSEQESGEKFDVGDRVSVDSDMARARELQQDHGGWTRGMEKYLDEQGRVLDIKGDIINVQFSDGQSLRFNALLLTKTGMSSSKKKPSGKLVKGKFKMLDIVRVKVNDSQLSKLQSGHGGFNKRMKNVLPIRGVVNRVFDDGDVYVEFLNGDKWCLNPDALELVDTSGIEIEAGDVIIVKDDKDEVIKLQKGHGDWVDSMAKCLGKSGIVKKVGVNHVAVVEIDDSVWTWNTRALKLVAKGEELLHMMVAKHLGLEEE